MKTLLVATLATLMATSAMAKPVTYNLDPMHTYPSFEADHMGISKWRGKVDKTSGQVVLDREAKKGTVDVTLQMDSIDFGFGPMNDKAKSAELFDTAKYPTATYKGTLVFNGDSPVAVDGILTLHGVAKPVRLDIKSWKCIINPMMKREDCGADAHATFNRADFGVDFGKTYGFDMTTNLAIQVEGIRAD